MNDIDQKIYMHESNSVHGRYLNCSLIIPEELHKYIEINAIHKYNGDVIVTNLEYFMINQTHDTLKSWNVSMFIEEMNPIIEKMKKDLKID
jgi:hypothetical protein